MKSRGFRGKGGEKMLVTIFLLKKDMALIIKYYNTPADRRKKVNWSTFFVIRKKRKSIFNCQKAKPERCCVSFGTFFLVILKSCPTMQAFNLTLASNTNAETILTFGSTPRLPPGERERVRGANWKEFNAFVLARSFPDLFKRNQESWFPFFIKILSGLLLPWGQPV